MKYTEADNEIKLKPCPFCASKVNTYTSTFGIIHFKCTNPDCGAIISFDNDECNNTVIYKKLNAIKAYNRRVE